MSKAISTAKARGQVEKWLLELECEMKETILMQIQTTFKNYSTEPFDEWILQYPGQCVIKIFLIKNHLIEIYNNLKLTLDSCGFWDKFYKRYCIGVFTTKRCQKFAEAILE